MKLRMKLVSSLTKVMPWEKVPAEREFTAATALRGEVFSFQAAYYSENHCPDMALRLESPLLEHLTARQVGLVPAQLLNWEFDDNIITGTPGLFPDPLLPLPEKITAFPLQWRSVWITIRIPADYPAGIYPVTVAISHPEKGIDEQKTFFLEVLPIKLP